MIALVATATQETDAVIVAALAAFWLWRHGKLGRTVRKAARVAVCVGAVVVAVRVSPALCVLAAGTWLAWWAWTHRHARERRRFQKAWDRGWRRGVRHGQRRYMRRRGGQGGWEIAYRLHMNSTEWHRQRDRIVARDHRRCVACGNRYSLNGHHTYYTNPIGHEPDEAIVTLCEPCHKTVHVRHKATGGPYHDYRQATRYVIDRTRQKAA